MYRCIAAVLIFLDVWFEILALQKMLSMIEIPPSNLRCVGGIELVSIKVSWVNVLRVSCIFL